MYYHMIAFLAGFLLDLLIGDPHWLYHPVRLIGNLIAALDHRLLDVTGKIGRASCRERVSSPV